MEALTQTKYRKASKSLKKMEKAPSKAANYPNQRRYREKRNREFKKYKAFWDFMNEKNTNWIHQFYREYNSRDLETVAAVALENEKDMQEEGGALAPQNNTKSVSADEVLSEHLQNMNSQIVPDKYLVSLVGGL